MSFVPTPISSFNVKDDADAVRHPDSARHTAAVRVETGWVRGVPAIPLGVTAFKGIPYAAPPVGERRWRPPAPAVPWEGVREAAHAGPACPQTDHGVRWPQDEDCLTANVWCPDDRDEPHPVLVWIHGGRFIWGHGAEALYDGGWLAQAGLVVVTFNYRLGVFGFLATPGLSAESEHHVSGNWGLLDQIAALQWVQRNIGAFGGDPAQVTIAGQSGGAASVADLVYSPLAAGLFRGAIAESGVRYPRDPGHKHLPPSYRTRQEAERDGESYVRELGARTVAEMRALPVATLLSGNDRIQGSSMPSAPLFRPVQDGWVLPGSYEEMLASDRQNDVPVVVGCNRDEDGVALEGGLTVEEFAAHARARYGDAAAEFLRLYPASTDAEAQAQENAAFRDAARVSTLLWARERIAATHSRVFTYFWTHVPPGPTAHLDGAYHMSEIGYFFNNLCLVDRPWSQVDRDVAVTCSRYVVNFVSHGDPNAADLPRWPAASLDRNAVMELGDRFGPIPAAQAERFAFHERYLRAQRPW